PSICQSATADGNERPSCPRRPKRARTPACHQSFQFHRSLRPGIGGTGNSRTLFCSERSTCSFSEWLARKRVSLELHGQLANLWVGGRSVFALGHHWSRCDSLESGVSGLCIGDFFSVRA